MADATAGPEASESGHTHETACVNCGAPLDGPFCRMCGQKAHIHRNLRGFLHDVVHGVFHFEGKAWRTLRMLVLHPGELTRRYAAGERKRFMSPVGLFLFSVFVMFTVLQISSAIEPEPETAQTVATTEESGRIVIDSDGEGGGRLTFDKTGWDWVDRGIAKASENPTLMLQELKANSYKFSWLLIPLSFPLVWLLFAWRRRFGPFDHAVFVTYSLCFVSLLYVILWVLDWLGVPGAVRLFAALFIPPVHIYRQLREAYGLRRLSALWRTAALVAAIPIILLTFFNILMMIGILS